MEKTSVGQETPAQVEARQVSIRISQSEARKEHAVTLFTCSFQSVFSSFQSVSCSFCPYSTRNLTGPDDRTSSLSWTRGGREKTAQHSAGNPTFQ